MDWRDHARMRLLGIPFPIPVSQMKTLILHLITESDNKTACPIRIGGFLVLGVLIYYALNGIMHKTGDNFQDVCKGFAWFIGTWAGAIGGKSKLGGDADGSQSSH